MVLYTLFHFTYYRLFTRSPITYLLWAFAAIRWRKSSRCYGVTSLTSVLPQTTCKTTSTATKRRWNHDGTNKWSHPKSTMCRRRRRTTGMTIEQFAMRVVFASNWTGLDCPTRQVVAVWLYYICPAVNGNLPETPLKCYASFGAIARR